jgi:hypothetical protein
MSWYVQTQNHYDKNQTFEFNEPTSTNPSKYHKIEKLKEVIKKTKPLNKNSEIYESSLSKK